MLSKFGVCISKLSFHLADTAYLCWTPWFVTDWDFFLEWGSRIVLTLTKAIISSTIVFTVNSKTIISSTIAFIFATITVIISQITPWHQKYIFDTIYLKIIVKSSKKQEKTNIYQISISNSFFFLIFSQSPIVLFVWEIISQKNWKSTIYDSNVFIVYHHIQNKNSTFFFNRIFFIVKNVFLSKRKKVFWRFFFSLFFFIIFFPIICLIGGYLV